MKGFLPVLPVLAMLALFGGCSKQDKRVKYGKVLVAEYSIPADTLEKFANHKPKPPPPGGSAIEKVLLTDTEEWYGPSIDVKSTANPYTMVVRMTGTALAEGDAATMWQAGWQLDGGRRYSILPGLSKPGAKAGERFSVTVPVGGVSFKEDRTTGVALAFVNKRNVRIESVDVELWSGIASTSWREMLGAFSYLLTALVFFALIWFWRRKRE